MLHTSIYLTANGYANLLSTIAIHIMNASVFSHCFLEAVLQLTLTVVFKQLRLHHYCLMAMFGHQNSEQVLGNRHTQTYCLSTVVGT